MILITSADHYIGHCVTSHLARYDYLRKQLRVLCQDKAPCLNFVNKGIDVRQIDYMHPNDLALAFQGVDHMILAIGNEADRVACCERLCQAASRSGVKSIVCISHVGAVSSDHETLGHYASIEDEVITSECQWTILRPDWIHQNFHFWSTHVEKNRHLPLPIPESAEICPLDITDLCRAVENLLITADKKDIRPELIDDHVGQVYTLTGPQAVNGKQLVYLLSKTTGFEKFEYRYVRPMDTAYYLDDLPKDIWFDARVKHEKSQIYSDSLDGYDYRTRLLRAPTPTQTKTFLEYFDWVHNQAGSLCVPHVSIITALPPRSIRKFFQENANSFKPRI
ncbi:hypothetical protein BDB00DRAFT_947798 [Zychaea mexicana]|uniref:uncharacterized protein n=1 Tax=Zychaea mexicana TaxID=64656 RepID=UPI0022FE199E|nr:uncharacterized protein BDB00DRAFT_947798 [Zychaea mexicana]KAI9487916.1 hypothetical protein BDB00DRAFT_947798 [Zychaea mexicana]